MQRNYQDNYADPSSSVNTTGHVKGSLGTLSPYLNFDPRTLPPSQPEYLLPEGSKAQRGHLEYAFMQIAASWILGGGAGGAVGLYQGYRVTSLAGLSGRPRITQLINYTSKNAAPTSAACGVIALMYSGSAVLLSWLRGAEDEFNTIGAATFTGCLYRSAGGLKKSAVGGAVGLAVGIALCLSQSTAFTQFKKQRNPY